MNLYTSPYFIYNQIYNIIFLETSSLPISQDIGQGFIQTLSCTQRILWLTLGSHFSRSMVEIVPTSPYELQIYRRIKFCCAQNLLQVSICDQIINNAEIIKKTLSIFFLSNRWLHQQYHRHNYAKYSDLINDLL